jgi:geranylgeranyl transferase type-2 subunit alpha
MFHGNKKKESNKPLTEEELQKAEEMLLKIKAIQKNILDKSEKNDLDEKNLDYLTKAAQIMNDFYTLWNYRKRIILEMKKNKSDEEFLKFIKTEINQVSYFQKNNPKSYVLWNHRIWNLENACQIEKSLSTPLENSLLMQEINLCNMFFEKDDRNFHVWNHRYAMFKMIHESFQEKFLNFLDKELEFTITMIKKNCSNFSAWHYRSKLITIYFQLYGKDWNSEDALSYFKTDLELITNAVYTDPKDQSPWNYHSWIINNLSPPYVINYIYI